MVLGRRPGDSRDLIPSRTSYSRIESEAELDLEASGQEEPRKAAEGHGCFSPLLDSHLLDALNEGIVAAGSFVTGGQPGVFITPDGNSHVKAMVWCRLSALCILLSLTMPAVLFALGLKHLVFGTRTKNVGLMKACVSRVVVLLHALMFLALSAPSVLYVFRHHNRIITPSMQLARVEVMVPLTSAWWMSGLFCALVMDHLFQEAGAQAIDLAVTESRSMETQARDFITSDCREVLSFSGQDTEMRGRLGSSRCSTGLWPEAVCPSFSAIEMGRRRASSSCTWRHSSVMVTRRSLTDTATRAFEFLETVNLNFGAWYCLRGTEHFFCKTCEDKDIWKKSRDKALHEPLAPRGWTWSWGSLGLLILVGLVHAAVPETFRLVCYGWHEALLPADPCLLALRISFAIFRFVCNCAWFDRFLDSILGLKLMRQKYILTLFMSATDDHRRFVRQFHQDEIPTVFTTVGAEEPEVPTAETRRPRGSVRVSWTVNQWEGLQLKAAHLLQTDPNEEVTQKLPGLRGDGRILCVDVFMLMRRYFRAVLAVECLQAALTILLLLLRLVCCMVSCLSILFTVDKLVPDFFIALVDGMIAIVCIIVLLSEVIATGNVIHRDTRYILHGWKSWVNRLHSSVVLRLEGQEVLDVNMYFRSKAQDFAEACEYIREVDEPLMLLGVPFTSETRNRLILSFLSFLGFALWQLLKDFASISDHIYQLGFMSMSTGSVV